MKEKLRFLANERLLASKGYLLFTVNQYGVLSVVSEQGELTKAESDDLIKFAKGFKSDYLTKHL